MAESNFGDGPAPAPQHGHEQRVQMQPQRYKFTPDELRCLKECNRESFYYRSLPISSVLAAGTFYAVRYGYLKASPRLGAAPKMLLAGLTGYFIGKFSYQQACVEKILQLPNSPLADMIRSQKSGKGGSFTGINETLTFEPNFATTGIASGSGTATDDSYSSSKYFSDVSDARPHDSFDTSDYNSSYQDNELQMKEDTLPPKPPQFFTSYDQLRKQNREEYEKKIHGSSLNGIPDSPRRTQDSNHNQQPQFSYPPSSGTYGDIWDGRPQQ